MKYRRMPIEIEAPEGIGYDKIECNLSESSFTDLRLGDLGLNLGELVLLYGDHRGKPELRALIAGEYHGVPEDILISAGAANALFIVATSLIEKGDHVLVAKPNYATNIETPRAIGAEIQFIQLEFNNGFILDVDKLEERITPQTKIVSLTYPHNPTGAILSDKELFHLIQIIEKKQCFLLIDETYRDMRFAAPVPVAASLSDRVISVFSMSKSFGLPGIRIGWIYCRNKALMEIFLAAKEQIQITNSVLDEEVAYKYMLEKEKRFAAVRKRIFENFTVLKSFMETQDKLEWVEPKGGCVCFPRMRNSIQINIDKFHQLLLEKYKTYVGRGHWFEEEGRYIRIGYGWDTTENLKKGLNNILLSITELTTFTT
jgi:aspartate/methionine/tyrosine aminotransferase